MRIIGHSSIRIVVVALSVAGASVFGAEAHSQSGRDDTSAMQAPDCRIERINPINEDGSLAKTEHLLELERRHAAAPADKVVAWELTQELFDLAQYMMYCSPSPPNRKYILAYCLYGRVLELDEANEAAAQSRKMIEGIYKQLGKPLPEYDCH